MATTTTCVLLDWFGLDNVFVSNNYLEGFDYSLNLVFLFSSYSIMQHSLFYSPLVF